MQNVPVLSIVIPSYNQGIYLEETILSVLEQNYPKLQLIVIDGESKDQTVAIIKKYEKHLHYWVSEADHGQAHAINKGLKIATGDLHSFLNSDDLLLPNALLTIAELYNKEKKQLITAPWLEGETTKTAITRQVVEPITIENFILTIGLFGQPGTFWTAEEKPILLNESYHYCLDFEFFYQLLKNKYSIEIAEQPLAFFRQHIQAKTATLQLKKYREIVTFFETNTVHHPNISIQMKEVMTRNKRTLYRLELVDALKNHPLGLLPKLWNAIKYDPRVFIKGI